MATPSPGQRPCRRRASHCGASPHRLIRSPPSTAGPARRHAEPRHRLRRLGLHGDARRSATSPRPAGASAWRCATRTSAYRMRLLGDVGQIDVVQANIRNRPSRRARAGRRRAPSLNLVGVLLRDRPPGLPGGARHGRAATSREAARAHGRARLVQMSALGADPDSPSKYARTKAEGEAAVREIYPDATDRAALGRVRPRTTASSTSSPPWRSFSPVLPLIGGGQTRFQPVFVGDVARRWRRRWSTRRTRPARPTSSAARRSSASAS